jgi:ABC-type glucose/galactose transport system permease subunit
VGILSILLGIIAFFGFTAGGAVLASTINSIMKNMANTFVTMGNVSSTTVSVVVIAAGAFIGLLVGLNLIMHGLTYNRIAKLYNQLKRRM